MLRLLLKENIVLFNVVFRENGPCDVGYDVRYKERVLLNGSPVSLITPWCRVLLEKLTGLQLVNKFPAFHGTRRFITALTSVRHLSLSWASPIQSI